MCVCVYICVCVYVCVCENSSINEIYASTFYFVISNFVNREFGTYVL